MEDFHFKIFNFGYFWTFGIAFDYIVKNLLFFNIITFSDPPQTPESSNLRHGVWQHPPLPRMMNREVRWRFFFDWLSSRSCRRWDLHWPTSVWLRCKRRLRATCHQWWTWITFLSKLTSGNGRSMRRPSPASRTIRRYRRWVYGVFIGRNDLSGTVGIGMLWRFRKWAVFFGRQETQPCRRFWLVLINR